MFTDQVRAAIMAAPRDRLADLSRDVWRAHGAGELDDNQAQELAELIKARKIIPAPKPAPPRRVGSRPLTPESLARRRRWVASGIVPPIIAAGFTAAENAALAVIALEATRKGRCTLTVGHVAALAGVCKTIVRRAVRQAAGAGLICCQERRLSAFRSDTNIVTVISPEWLSWLKLSVRRNPKGGGCKSVLPTAAHLSLERKQQAAEPRQISQNQQQSLYFRSSHIIHRSG